MFQEKLPPFNKLCTCCTLLEIHSAASENKHSDGQTGLSATRYALPEKNTAQKESECDCDMATVRVS